MAGKDAVIEVEEDGVVTVDIGGDADLAAAADQLADAGTVKEPGEGAGGQRTSKPSDADKAAAALTQSLRTSEEARKAAEATAAAERNARAQTEQTLAQREQEAKELREKAEASELVAITTGIENATRTMDTLTAEVERAMEAGDFKAQATAQAKLASAAAARDRLETDKANFDAGSRKVAPSTEGRVVESAVSPFERYVAGFAPKAQTWLRQHPECAPAQVGGNATKNASMMAGHWAALAKGLTEGTDDYFNVIEEHAGYREPVSTAGEVTLAGDREVRKPQQQQRRVMPAAPPTRDGDVAGGGTNTRSVKLNPQQQEAALFSTSIRPGETEEAFRARAFGSYAREYLKAQSEGKIGRMTH